MKRVPPATHMKNSRLANTTELPKSGCNSRRKQNRPVTAKGGMTPRLKVLIRSCLLLMK